MAEVTGNAYKTIGKLFENEVGKVKLVYDFANDGGATADTVTLGAFSAKSIVTNCVAHVETACTSGGSAVVNIGILAGDVDAFVGDTAGAVASLTLDATIKEDAGQKLYVAADGKVSVSIATAALTAGKIVLHMEYKNAS